MYNFFTKIETRFLSKLLSEKIKTSKFQKQKEGNAEGTKIHASNRINHKPKKP